MTAGCFSTTSAGQWPKHGCTDGRAPERLTRSPADSQPRPEPVWQLEGWSPLLSSRISQGVERFGIRGDCDGSFVDLTLPAGTKIDRDTPILVRPLYPSLHEESFLASDRFTTQRMRCIA